MMQGGKISTPDKSGSALQKSIFIVGGDEHDTDHGFVGNHDGGNHIDDYNCTIMKRPKRKREVHQTCPHHPHIIYFPICNPHVLKDSHS